MQSQPLVTLFSNTTQYLEHTFLQGFLFALCTVFKKVYINYNSFKSIFLILQNIYFYIYLYCLKFLSKDWFNIHYNTNEYHKKNYNASYTCFVTNLQNLTIKLVFFVLTCTRLLPFPGDLHPVKTHMFNISAFRWYAVGIVYVNKYLLQWFPTRNQYAQKNIIHLYYRYIKYQKSKQPVLAKQKV